ncbi:MAG TPA: NAD(+) synthase [Gammaproteobacteria bacterium]|nr:NAD(+) synthase [Gammaproteobacteria bacterium]
MKFNQLPNIALVQMEVRPGRPDLNVARMLEHMERARDAGAEIVVFSEMCIPGYIIGDLWEVDALVEDFAAYSAEIVAASESLTVLFGNVAIDKSRIGEDGRARKYNAVHVCSNGRYLTRPDVPGSLPQGVLPKTLHPNYRFFDDDRHFYSLRKLAAAEGRPLSDWLVPFEVTRREGGSFRFGVQLCEDIWCQDYALDHEVLDTLRMFHRRGADAVFNLSASPWTWQKNAKRSRVVHEVLARSPLPFFYVNHVGAQNNGKNILVFDGDTTAYASDGEICQRATSWREQMLLVPDGDAAASAPRSGLDDIYEGIITGLRHLDHVRGQENGFLIGVSGGIDSSVALSMLVQAFGPDRVFAVNMPSRFNAGITRDNARRICENLAVDYLSCSIQDLYELLSRKIRDSAFPGAAGNYTRLVDENIQARIRGADLLAGLAAKCGLIFTNNGNKTETALGYATLYGDVNGAVAPIADLYKTQVFELARYLNQEIFGREVIPSNLITGEVVPSAELSEAQDVTRGLGDPIRYGYHDALLRQLIEYRRHPLDVLDWFLRGRIFIELEYRDEAEFLRHFAHTRAWVEDLEWIDRQLRVSFFKRIQAPPIIVLSKRAFGFDLRESQLPEYLPKAYAALKSEVLDRDIRSAFSASA